MLFLSIFRKGFWNKILFFFIAFFILTLFFVFMIPLHGNRSYYFHLFQFFLIAAIIFIMIKTKMIGIAQLIIGIIVFITLSEVYLRFFHQKQDTVYSNYQKVANEYGRDWEKMKKELEVCRSNRSKGNFSGGNSTPYLKYYDYFLFSPYPHSSCNEEITDFFSARLVPSSFHYRVSDYTIWFFGGSTMQNIETTDSLTIANQAGILLLNKGIKPTLFNFGAITYPSSLECIKFIDVLRRIKTEEYPDVVVFYNGFNDGMWAWEFGAGNIQKDLSEKIKIMVEEDYHSVFLYSSNRIIGKYLKTWEYFLSSRIESCLFPQIFVFDTTIENLNKAVSVYVSNIKIEKAICNAFGILPIFILQPAIFTKNPLTKAEKEILSEMNRVRDGLTFLNKFYDKIRFELHNDKDFYDLSHVLDGHGKSDFYDYVHTSPFTPLITGDTIGKIIFSKLARQIRENETQ